MQNINRHQIKVDVENSTQIWIEGDHFLIFPNNTDSVSITFTKKLNFSIPDIFTATLPHPRRDVEMKQSHRKFEAAVDIHTPNKVINISLCAYIYIYM